MNPPPSLSNSFDDVLKRLLHRARQHKLDDQILTMLQQTFEKEFDKENVALSRPERVRLYQQVAKAILSDVAAKIDHI